MRRRSASPRHPDRQRSKRRDSRAAFAEDGRAEARLEKIHEERSASEMNPLNLSKSELEKFGVTYKDTTPDQGRSEEHTSELQSLRHLVCRLLLEKKKYS